MRHARLLLPALVLVACLPAPAPGVTYSADGVRFTAPPGWDVRIGSTDPAQPLATVALLANQPIDAECRLPQPCATPLDELAPAGVLVLWVSDRCLPDCQLPDKGRMLVGGREAARITGDVRCGVGPTAEMIMIAVTPQRIDRISACYGGDDPAARTAFEALLGSIAWTVP